MIRNLLILDTETSSLDPTTGRLLEVATALWSVEHRSLVKVRSWIVRSETNEAESVNGIPVALLRDHPHASNVNMTNKWVQAWATEADCIVAHSSDFDRQWFGDAVQALPWACSCNDIEWPRPSTSRGLTALALAHGVGVVAAHRALDDVMTLVRLFERAAELGGNLEVMLTRALRPKALFEVADRGYSPERNALAKANGFRFDDKDAGNKRWIRSMAVEDAEKLPFAVQRVAA